MPRERLTEHTSFQINDWHRAQGEYLPATDLDCLLVEYDHGVPKALIEYKHENWRCPDWNSKTFLALRELAAARRYELPLFVAKYADDCRSFNVQPLNAAGLAALRGSFRKQMSEEEYTRFLHKLRSE